MAVDSSKDRENHGLSFNYESYTYPTCPKKPEGAKSKMSLKISPLKLNYI
jgi:hypothetical protein